MGEGGRHAHQGEVVTVPHLFQLEWVWNCGFWCHFFGCILHCRPQFWNDNINYFYPGIHGFHMNWVNRFQSEFTGNSRIVTHLSDTSHISVTSVTPITKKGNYISSDAHFSWHQEYPGHMIYPSFLIEKNEKYWKKHVTSQFMLFLFLEKKLSHLMHNFLGIENILVT